MDQAKQAVDSAWESRLAEVRSGSVTEMVNSSITINKLTMSLLNKAFGEAPAGGRPLVISLHGGGQAAKEVNDQQWINQIHLYQPEGAIYIAPRAPTNNWNLWHEPHMDAFYDRLIMNCVAVYGINPDRVYIMGYSAGGDGVYQMAPRMADRFAAASMMAGHPNETMQDGLRNLPFGLLFGGKDTGVNRNVVCKKWGAELQELAKKNPGEYIHFYRCYEDKGHWMDLKDAEAVPWMLGYTRKVWPKRVTWLQDDVVSGRFYWLSVDPKNAKAGDLIDAVCSEQTITITTTNVKELTLRLSDELLDLDKEISVVWNGVPVFKGKVLRTKEAIAQSLKERFDRQGIATALLPLKLAPAK